MCFLMSTKSSLISNVPSLFYRAAKMNGSLEDKEEKFEVRKFYFSVKTI